MSAGFRSPLAWWVGGGAAVASGSSAVPGFRSPAAMWMGGAAAVPPGGGDEHPAFASPLAWWMGGACAAPSTEPPGGTRSPWNRPYRGVQYRRWFYSNWMPQPAEALPQTPVKVVRGRIVPATGRTGALRAPTSRHRPPPEERPFQMGGVRSGIATAIAPPRVAPGRQGREHTAIDEDIEALLAALLMLDED